MSKFFLLLQSVHDKVHDSNMLTNYSEPRIYTGSVDINTWSKLSKEQKKEALSKKWYVYYSFRDPDTGKLKRQTNIKGRANRYKDKKNRYAILSKLREALEIFLSHGFNPYLDNTDLAQYIENKYLKTTSPITADDDATIKESKVKRPSTTSQQTTTSNIEEEQVSHTIEEAIAFGLSYKSRILGANSFVKFKSRINRFKKWLEASDISLANDISTINKKTVLNYLNSVLQTSSPRNRNNTRTDIGSLFQTLVDNDIIPQNFIKEINVLKAVPERNKTYTTTQQEEIFNYLKEQNSVLYLFVLFVSYNFLRPIEVCRLKVKDLDLRDKKIKVRAKNKPVKVKIIPDILLHELPDLSKLNKEDYLFTPTKIGGEWDTEESNKRDFFTKQFKQVKDYFELGKDYGLYSFRHTFITKLYKEMLKTGTPLEVKSRLQLITGHSTLKALEAYLRDIDAELPDDYTKYFE